MSWEVRNRRPTRYYYTARKVNGRVLKGYVGRGPAAELAASLDAQARRRRAEAAEALRAEALLAEPVEAEDGELWVHELIGATVVDTDGRDLGRVEAVEANPASDLLVLEGGGLVPLRFVVDREPGRLTVDVPAGLLDL